MTNAEYLFGGYLAMGLVYLIYWWSLRQRERFVERELDIEREMRSDETALT
ncbi:hypothetical protein ARMA_0037 [Ardenticatena maritima]|uniref:CcmD family protein n=1 Tax=Ardenticatena maritima TaxID=872965 RepID=A0A0M9UBA2_9CHLR|nr:hypothetical protein [Ardenticatena maritima]GAP61614.1 hypothetical protein ARMA_0037 [Ardenticatena maritima]